MSATISASDKQILRELAKRQMSYAKSERNLTNIKDWTKHNDLCGDRPMIQLELGSFVCEVIPHRLRCEGEKARELEQSIYRSIINYEVFEDDMVVPDFFPVHNAVEFTLFGLHIARTHANDSSGREFGHKFNYVIDDLEADFDKLKPSTFTVDRAKTEEDMAVAQDTFGDILPSKLVMSGIYSVPTQKIVHIMGMETMLFSMYDYPELFHKMMKQCADDTIAYFLRLESEHLLLPTVGANPVGNGTWAFTTQLPAENVTKCGEVWGFMDSQETVGISPEMFEEFIFPYYKQISQEYGLLSYGCCEPVHPIWENCLSKLSNLRKLSISAWCDEDYMGERLKGSKVIYHRKPSANYLGLGEKLDESALRGHIRKTLEAAKGCKLEITQRDVYTINNDEEKARRFIEIIRQEVASCW